MIKIRNTFKSYDEYKKFYQDSSGYDLTIDKITPSDDVGVPNIHRWEWGLSKLKEINAKRVLDVGAWTGRFPLILQRNGFYVEAVEANKAAYKFMVKNVPDIVSHNKMFEEFDGDKFEAITAFEIVEHLYDLDKFISQVKKHLVPSGYLIFSTPAKGGIYDDDNKIHLWIGTLESIIDWLVDFDVVDFEVGDLILIMAKLK